MRDIQKNATQVKIFLFLVQDILKNCILDENLTHRCTQTGQFFPKLGYFLSVLKKDRGNLPLSPFLVARIR